MKEVICEKYDLCVFDKCIHIRSHNNSNSMHDLGCNKIYCPAVGVEVKCVSVRKMKLNHLSKKLENNE